MMRGQKGEKRDPTRLLREEKMRKRIAKELPKVEQELRKTLEAFEDEYGRPFLVCGERYLDEMERAVPAKPPSARSKTPNGLPPRPASSAAMSRQGASTRPGGPSHQPSYSTSSMRGGHPLASVARTAGAQITPAVRNAGASAQSHAFSSSTTSIPVSAPGSRTPSRIPARVPLGSMRNGNNSPERRAPQATAAAAARQLPVNNKMPPPPQPQPHPHPTMAPPPRMRALQPPAPHALVPSHTPTPTPRYEADSRCPSAISSSSTSSVIRHVSPSGDVYHDDYDHQQRTPQSYRDLPPHASHASINPNAAMPRYERQFSHASASTATASTAASGSENWETYDDAGSVTSAGASEWGEYDGVNALHGAGGDGYVRQQPQQHGQQQKRPLPEVSRAEREKRIRVGLLRGERCEKGDVLGQVRDGMQGLVKVSGSEAGWTDEDAF